MTNGGSSHMLQAPGTPLTPDTQSLSGRLSAQGAQPIGNDIKADVQPSLSRLPVSQFGGSLAFDVRYH